MHYTFYGIKKYIKWEFRKYDIWKDIDCYIPYYYSPQDEEPRIRSQVYKQEDVKVFEETTDFDYTSVKYVEHNEKTYIINSISKIALEDEIKVYIDYSIGEEEGKENAERDEAEYKKKKESNKEFDKQNWLKRLFKIKS